MKFHQTAVFSNKNNLIAHFLKQLFQRQEGAPAGYSKIHAFFFEASQNLLETVHIKLTFTV